MSGSEEKQQFSVLDFDQQLSSGWNLVDLKEISKVANSKRSDSSAARVKALAKVTMLANSLDSTQSSFKQILFKLNPSVSVLLEYKNFIQVKLASNLKLPNLPAAYAFKGGAARIAMLNVLGKNTSQILPRDIDLIRIGDQENPQDRELAAKYMADDFKYGYGVEIQQSLNAYFESRDLTINELYLKGKRLCFSYQAFQDLQEGNIRLSKAYQSGTLKLNAKLICKMLRLKAELEELELKGKLFLPFNLPEISPADIGFHHQRALEKSALVADRYLELVKEHLNIDYSLSRNQTIKLKPSQKGCSVSNPQNVALRFQKIRKKHP